MTATAVATAGLGSGGRHPATRRGVPGSATAARLSGEQRKALRDLAVCRTAALGGHVEHCLDCGHERIAYNSCRNRHCPKCQALARAGWLEQQAEHLLPVEYHHVVFTLPAEVGELALANPAVVYDLLFAVAAGHAAGGGRQSEASGGAWSAC